jgi:hypothetical protein
MLNLRLDLPSSLHKLLHKIVELHKYNFTKKKILDKTNSYFSIVVKNIIEILDSQLTRGNPLQRYVKQALYFITVTDKFNCPETDNF